jgi:hypothetical protein
MRNKASPLQEATGITGYLDREKQRGMVTSIVAGVLATGLNYAGVVAMGLNPLVSTALFGHIVGSVISYSLDILFAKTHFRIRSSQPIVQVPFSHIGVRAKWWLRSFKKPQFLRFIIVLIIETLTALALLAAIIRTCDQNQWAMKYRDVRNFALALLAGIIVFLMFGNMLRFDWAYSEDGNLHLTASMLMWMSLSVMVFCLSGPGSAHDARGAAAAPVQQEEKQQSI